MPDIRGPQFDRHERVQRGLARILDRELGAEWLAGRRDAFWRAFWRRQQKHLPPAAYVHIGSVNGMGATSPVVTVETGREWKRDA